MTQNQLSLIKKIKLGRPEHLLTPIPLRPITSHFCLTSHPPMPPQSGRYMCVTPYVGLGKIIQQKMLARMKLIMNESLDSFGVVGKVLMDVSNVRNWLPLDFLITKVARYGFYESLLSWLIKTAWAVLQHKHLAKLLFFF